MDLNAIISLMDHFDASTCASLKYKTTEGTLELKKAAACQTVAPAPVMSMPAPSVVTPDAPVAPANTQMDIAPIGTTINAPLVGTFYHAANPEDAPFVSVGQTVKKGDTIGLIEAMKVINEIPAPMDCIIEEVLVEDGKLAAYDEPLLRVTEL